MVKKRREREREARRGSILDAAERIADQLGYSGLTMDAVASAAEVAKGTVYLYFSSKDALFAAIAHRRLSTMLPLLDAHMARETTGRAQVSGAARFFARYFVDHPERFRMISSWLLSTEPLDTSSEDFADYRAALGASLGSIIEAVARGRRDGSITLEGAPSAIALAMWHGLFGVLAARLAVPTLSQRVPFQPELDEVLRIYLEGIDHMLGSSSGTEEKS